jgi:hypothetical protein
MKDISVLIVFLFTILLVIENAASAGDSINKTIPYFGTNHEFVWTPDEEIPPLIQAMKDANVQIVRVPMRWTVIEGEQGNWNWDKMDSVIRQIKAAHIEILACLMGVPEWASGEDRSEVQGFWDCFAPKRTEDYAEFVRQCVNRYKNDIHYWEVWNEENGPDFYKPLPNAKEYVKLLKTAHNAIMRADPEATVVMGGLQMNGIISNPWLDIKVENFLQKIYDAGGKPYFDVVNIHPYVLPTKDQGPAYCAKLVCDTIDVMKRNGDGNKPLWITEIGTGTGQGVTEEMQAEHLADIYRELGNIPEVKAIYWFTLRDYGKSICGGEDSMGLLTADGRRKPAFETYRKLAEKK